MRERVGLGTQGVVGGERGAGGQEGEDWRGVRAERVSGGEPHPLAWEFGFRGSLGGSREHQEP